MSTSPETLSRGIDAVERNARGQLIAEDRGKVLRRSFATILPLVLVVPAIALIVQLGLWMSGQSAQWFSWGWLVPLSLLVPAVALFLRTFSSGGDVGRKRALIAMDRTLGSADRLVTADEFMHKDDANGFHKAAIEDAHQWVERGRISDIDGAEKKPLDTQRAKWLIPLAFLLLLGAFGVSRLDRAIAEEPSAGNNEEPTTPTITTEDPEEQSIAKPQPEEEEQPTEEQQPRERGKKKPAKKTTTPATSTPEEEEESKGRLTEGETSESQQSSNPSNAEGAPSPAGQPSKPEKTKVKKKKKAKKKPNTKEQKKKERESKEEEPSGATAGQGSSKGSNNNAAANDWSSKSQQSTPDDDDEDNDDDAEDDDEEQESRGGVQPNLRDRRTPVNRDLNIGLGSARPNPDANGRGGPGGQKKSRGVASMVLGVPIPDRVTGQPNKGRTRITQQRISPEAETADAVPAEDRGARKGTVGPIHHPEFSPWLQDYVRRYFLERRKAAEKKAGT